MTFILVFQCSCWYFSFVLLLLDVLFFVFTLFLSCCDVGVAFFCCCWCLVWATVVVFVTLFFSYYHCFCIIFLHYCSSHFHSSLGCPHVVDPFTLPIFFMLPLFHTTLFALLLLSCCSYCISSDCQPTSIVLLPLPFLILLHCCCYVLFG